MNTALEQAALAEHHAWMRALETERWGPSRSDPDQAIRELIARERFTTPAQQNNYRPTGKARP